MREASRLLDASDDELAAYAAKRLAALHGPDAATPDWLRMQPLADRASLRASMQELQRTLRSSSFEARKTSGSTGAPFRFVKDREMTAWMDAVMWAAYAWHGIAPGAREARFWGVPVSPLGRGRQAARDWLLHRRRLGAFSVTGDRCERFHGKLRSFRPQLAYGYPNLLRVFADECARRNLDGTELGLRVVITTGEVLSPATREVLRDFFGCPVVNEYGCTESGILSIECEHGTPHGLPIAALSEVVNTDGTPLGAGATGEVAVTDLHGRFAQLLRYRLHDRASWSPAGCRCGRALPSLAPASGRVNSFIETPQRGRVYAAILAYSIPPEVQRFRGYQRAPDRLHVDLVPGRGFHAHDTVAHCRRRLEEALGPGMSITFEVVESLPSEVSGKLRYFVPAGA